MINLRTLISGLLLTISVLTLPSSVIGQSQPNQLPHKQARINIWPPSLAVSLKGTKNIAIVVFGLQDASPVQSTEIAEARVCNTAKTQRTVANLIKYSSWGQLEISCDANRDGKNDIFGPYKVNFWERGGCQYRTWAKAARVQAMRDGFKASNYDYIIYILPSPKNYPNTQKYCGWLGFSNHGGRASYIGANSTDVIVHELGHSLRLTHSASAYPSFDEYGDLSCSMGAPGGMLPREFNAVQRDIAGWLDSNSTLVDLRKPGIFNFELAPLEIPLERSSLPRVVRIDLPQLYRQGKARSSERYYLSYRRNIGVFPYAPKEYVDKLNIHRYVGVTAGKAPIANSVFLTALKDGEVYNNPVGLKVTQISHSDQSVVLRVEIRDH